MANILIVDDEASIRVALAHLLARDHVTWLAGSVAEAMQLVRDVPLDVVVSDHDLPDGTGIEVLTFAKQEQPQALRVLSSGRTPHRLWAYMADGVVDRWFPKPFEVEALVELLHRGVTSPG